MVVQGDVTLRSQKGIVFLDKNQNVDTIHATGDVTVVRQQPGHPNYMSARGNEAFFYNASQTVSLKGNATITREGNTLTGKAVHYSITTGQIKVENPQGKARPPEKVKSNK